MNRRRRCNDIPCRVAPCTRGIYGIRGGIRGRFHRAYIPLVRLCARLQRIKPTTLQIASPDQIDIARGERDAQYGREDD